MCLKGISDLGRYGFGLECQVDDELLFTIHNARMTNYDIIAYPDHAHAQTHPDRLAVVGRLYGLQPAPISMCRVLELGCGAGGNLVPLAVQYPAGSFQGIDLAVKPIAQGNQLINDLSLTNIRLTPGDLSTIDASWGNFDYIIAHGVYSWVPATVRQALLRICRERLAPQGIAFVSYSALPGGHLTRVVRDLMLFHTRGVNDPDERLRQALAAVKFVGLGQDTTDEYRLWMKSELDRIQEHEEGHLFHDELAEINDPCYFSEFIGQAGKHGLQYLGETDFYEMTDYPFKDEVRAGLRQIAANRLVREQYLDFLKCRRFRQTLLCHREISLRAHPDPDAIRQFLVSSTALPVSEAPDGEGVTVFKARTGARFETDFPAGKVALARLKAAWPAPVAFDDLCQLSAGPAAETGGDSQAGPDLATKLAAFLFELYSGGIVQLHLSKPLCAPSPSTRPTASPLARWQAARGQFVTTAFHLTIKLEDAIGRKLLTALDGTRDRTALVEELLPLLQSQSPLPPDQADAMRHEIKSKLEPNLETLARLGLLIG
jgi:methyltransferase-like protein/2-polyprenyl-3-methyl-5-hydroxy-6-metoxy-1,4-benzoquinol methylase